MAFDAATAKPLGFDPSTAKVLDVAPVNPTVENPVQSDRGFPFDKPDTEYGSVLPLARNTKTGELSFAVPEMIRAPLRGMIEFGQDITGQGRPVGTEQPTPDEMNALAAMVGMRGMGLRSVASPAREITPFSEAGSITPTTTESAKAMVQRNALAKSMRNSEKTRQQASDVVRRRLEEDAEANGTTAEDIIDKVNKTRASGKPLSLMDTGENTRALAGNVFRQRGPSRNYIRQFLEGRDAGAADRLTGDIASHLATGSMRETAKQLIKVRSEQARPLWDQAMSGGSIAPLEDQLRQSLQAATGAKGTIAKEIAKIEREKPGALASRGAAGAEVRARYMDLHKKLQQAEADRQATLEMFKRAQSDRNANASGAVWNPRIQQFLDDPIIKEGLRKGLSTQRLEALARGEKFDPTEYAITGTDEAGNPIVGKVPNMRLLQSAKEGLDEILQGDAARDPKTGNLTKYGRAVDQVRQAFLHELDAINPDYKVARDAWSGKSASMDALQAGRNIFKDRSDQGRLFQHSPEEIAEEFGKLSPSNKEFYKLGVADALRERILKTGVGGDEAKAVIKSPWMKAKLRPLFKSDADFNRFVDAVTAERDMFSTKQKVMGGSDTAAREAEDQGNNLSAALGAAKGIAHASGGNYLTALSHFLRARRDLGIRPNPALNLEIARILSGSTLPPPIVRPEAPLRVPVPASGFPNTLATLARVGGPLVLPAPPPQSR